jgi:hypothetical protein
VTVVSDNVGHSSVSGFEGESADVRNENGL